MATTPKSISGLTSAAAARVVLWQSREFVTVPGNAMGLQATIPATGLLPGTIGDTGMVLQVVGGVPVWVEPAVKFVTTGSFSGTEDDIDLSAFVAQGYTRFKVMWQDWSGSANAIFLAQFSNNAGSSFATSGYGGRALYIIDATPVGFSQPTTNIQLTLTNVLAGTTFGILEFSVEGATVEWVYSSKCIFTGPVFGHVTGSGHCVLTGANAIRLAPTSGSSDSGTYTIHALKDF